MATGASSRRAALAALEAKQQSILLAVRAAIYGAARSGLTYVVVDYNLNSTAGDTLEAEGFTVTVGDDGRYEVDWTP
jgi:hypothetical protein